MDGSSGVSEGQAKLCSVRRTGTMCVTASGSFEESGLIPFSGASAFLEFNSGQI